jgi:hypothetical protein
MMKLFRKPRGEKRLSFAKIAQALNDAGMVSRTGKEWGASSVQAIIKRQKGTEYGVDVTREDLEKGEAMLAQR